MASIKPILNREFSTRERILLLILAILCVLGLYYFVVVKGTSDTISANQQKEADLQLELTTQQTAYLTASQKAAALEALGDLSKAPVINTYDNFKAEFSELSNILADADTFDITFDVPTVSGTTVRRVARITFTTGSYDTAFSLTEKLNSTSFKHLIGDMSLTETTAQNEDVIEGVVSMTIYETTEGATDLSGLVSAEEANS